MHSIDVDKKCSFPQSNLLLSMDPSSDVWSLAMDAYFQLPMPLCNIGLFTLKPT